MITNAQIEQLLLEMPEPVLTVYLNIDNADRANQALIEEWQIWLKNEFKRIEAEQGLANDPTWKSITGQASSWLDGFEAGGKTLALFVSEYEARDFRLHLPLENRVNYGKPYVAPLLWLLDEYESYLIVLVDQEKATLLSGYLGRVGREDHIRLDIDDYDWGDRYEYQLGAFAQGDFRDKFEAMIDEHRMRYFREVADRIEAFCRERGSTRIIFGGAEQSAHTVRDLLPARLHEQVVGVLPIPMRSEGHDIMDRALPAALEYERQHENAIVDEVINFARSGGRGALGFDDVMMALEQQRVELLVVPYPIADSRLAEELPLRVLESSGEIELVHGEAAERLKAEGGIGARLYYAIPSAGNTVPTQKDSEKGQREGDR